MDATPTYRTATPEDVDAIARQGQAAFIEAFGPAYTDEEIAGYFAKTYGAELQRAEVADPGTCLFLAEIDGELVGHLKLGPCALPSDLPEPSGEVKRFYLLKKAQGTQVARTLLAMAKAEALRRGWNTLLLSCWTGNDRALRFYRREGFAVIGQQDFAVGPRVDLDHIMAHRLSG